MDELSLGIEQAWPHTAPSSLDRAESLPIAPGKPSGLVAEHPDAAPQRFDTILRVVLHALLLLGILSFVAYDCLWLPFRTHTAASHEVPATSLNTRLPVSQGQSH